MKSVEDIDHDKPERLDGLILQLALDEYDVTDETALEAMTDKELQEVREWLHYRHLKASDHIIRKKRLIQPEFSKAFLVRRAI